MKTPEEIKSLVDERLASLYQSPVLASALEQPLFRELIKELQRLLARGGKRFRPYITYVSYTLYGGKQEQEVIAIGTALELIHGFLLVHDDIIDQDLVRHGGPNLTARYMQKFTGHVAPGTEERLGEGVALIGGDICHLLAQHSLLQAQLPPARALALSRVVTESTLAAAVGELLDLALPLRKHYALSVKAVTDMYAQKTASYSLVGPLQLGAMLTDQPARELAALKAFGEPLGVAYQLQDDLIGIFGNEKQIGKSTLSDIHQGKQTPLYLYALKGTDSNQRKTLDKWYGNSHATHEQAKVIQNIFIETGGVAKTEALLDKYFTDSQKALFALSLSPKSKQVLEQLSLTLIKRAT